MKKLLYRSYNLLLATETFLLLLFLFTAILLASTQIILRNFFDSGIYWADSALRIMVLWIGMVGAMYASRHRKHIRIDILSRYLPEKIKTPVWRLTEFISAVVCAIAAYYSFNFVLFEYKDGLLAFANIPVWLCESIIPLAFLTMSLRYFYFALLGVDTLNDDDLINIGHDTP